MKCRLIYPLEKLVKFVINNIESNPNTPQEKIAEDDPCNGEQDYIKSSQIVIRK